MLLETLCPTRIYDAPRDKAWMVRGLNVGVHKHFDGILTQLKEFGDGVCVIE